MSDSFPLKPKIYRAITVGVKCPEHVLREFWSITIGEKIPVNLFELLDSEVAAGAVLEEAFVPLLDRRVRNFLQGLNSYEVNLEPQKSQEDKCNSKQKPLIIWRKM